VQEGLLLFTYREKGKENKMWGLPDSAVLGTVKAVKRRAKKSAHKRHRPTLRTHKVIGTTTHKPRSVAELLELARHAE
jgi:hypothetical protein